MSKNEEYLGDGVYVRHDGYQIWLRTPRENGDHEIALEDVVYNRLVAYVTKLRARLASEDVGRPVPPHGSGPAMVYPTPDEPSEPR